MLGLRGLISYSAFGLVDCGLRWEGFACTLCCQCRSEGFGEKRVEGLKGLGIVVQEVLVLSDRSVGLLGLGVRLPGPLSSALEL